VTNRLPKSLRLLKKDDFDRVFERRLSRADRYVVIYGCSSESEDPRFGLVVSRKCGDAVRRNRWKRCIREAFRQVQRDLPGGIDMAIIPRAGVLPEVEQLKRSIVKLAHEIHQRVIDPSNA